MCLFQIMSVCDYICMLLSLTSFYPCLWHPLQSVLKHFPLSYLHAVSYSYTQGLSKGVLHHVALKKELSQDLGNKGIPTYIAQTFSLHFSKVFIESRCQFSSFLEDLMSKATKSSLSHCIQNYDFTIRKIIHLNCSDISDF